MDAGPTILRKEYSEPFVLDRGKLSRMLTIIEQEVLEPPRQFQPEFEVVFKNNKRVVLHSIQDLMSLDNAIANPIRELEVKANLPIDTATSPNAAGVQLDFDSSRYHNINMSVFSRDTKGATELFAELEEQIDRTIVTNWIARYIKSQWGRYILLLLGMVLALVIAAIMESGPDQTGPQSHLTAADSAELVRILSAARTDSEKIDALVQAELRQIRALSTSPVHHLNWASIFSLRTAFIVLPVAVLIATLIYLIAACYPWVVFAWGDWEEHYNSLLSRRRMLSGVIIVALFIGTLANLFVASIPPLR